MKRQHLVPVLAALGLLLGLLVVPAAAQPAANPAQNAIDNQPDVAAQMDHPVFGEGWSVFGDDESSDEDSSDDSSDDNTDDSSDDVFGDGDDDGLWWTEPTDAPWWDEPGDDESGDEDDDFNDGTGDDESGDDESGDDESGDDTGDDTGDDDSGDDSSDDGSDGVTEERSVTPAPPLSDPSVVTGDGWVSYPNPRNQMPSPETAVQDPSIKVCTVLLNQADEVITGTSVSGTTITMDTSIERYSEADPVTFVTPLDQYADLIGTSPALPEGDGFLDAECVEFHNIEEGQYTYSPPSITGEHADEIEFVGVTEYAGARPSGNPFDKEVFDFGTNDLSDGEFNLEGSYDQRHGEAIYFFRLTG